MDDARKLELLERAHRELGLSTNELDIAEVVELHNDGLCDYAGAGGGTCWNTLLITHSGREEALRLRELVTEQAEHFQEMADNLDSFSPIHPGTLDGNPDGPTEE